MLGCTVMQSKDSAVVCVGPDVHLVLIKSNHISEEDVKAMEGVHVCFHANHFEALYHTCRPQPHMDQPLIHVFGY